MARPEQPQGGSPPAGPATHAASHAGSDHSIDWVAAERSPEFRELVRTRRSFVVPCLIFVFVWYFGFIALAGYAPDFMGERIVEGLTVGYVLALSQFVMTWVLAGLYLRRAERVFDPLAARAAARATRTTSGGGAATPPPAAEPEVRR